MLYEWAFLVRIIPSAAEQVQPAANDQAHLSPSWSRCHSSCFDQTPSERRWIKAIQVVEMLVQNTVITTENIQQIVVNKCGMTAPSHGYGAGCVRCHPAPSHQIQVDNLRTIDFLLRMIRTVAIAAATENVHAIVENGCRVEVAVRWRLSRSLNEPPLHCFQIEAMHFARELIDLFFESTEYVHVVAGDARRMTITDTRHTARHLWLRPAQRLGIKAEENVAAGLVIAATPHIHFTLVGDRCMAVALEWHLRIR